MAITVRTVMNHVLNGVISGPEVPRFTKISPEVWQLVVDFHLCPYIKYSLQCANFHQTHLPNIVHCRISPRSRRNEEILGRNKVRILLYTSFREIHSSFNSCGLDQRYRILSKSAKKCGNCGT
jgi:hypothetical protein